MPLTTTDYMLLRARENSYAVAAFNCENMEMIQAVISAGEEMNAPVIIQTTPSTIRYATTDLFAANAIAAAKKSKIPFAVHLDHGDSFELAEEALRSGYTSIMMDGSHFPLDKNIAFTKRAAELCKSAGIPIEGELGRVGGKEDDLVSGGCEYTDPDEAVRFVAETGINSLAVGIGTSHGIYKTTPVLKPELISILKEKLSVPLVMHGASGIADDVIRDCIDRGISKVNYATELRVAYTKAVREYLIANPDCLDPKKYGDAARKAVKELVIERITVCGCKGKA